MIKGLINARKESDINEFCYYETCDEQEAEEVYESILERAHKYEEE